MSVPVTNDAYPAVPYEDVNGAAMDLTHNYENLVVSSVEHYERSLNTMRNLSGSGKVMGLGELTANTMEVQTASTELEIINGAIKSATQSLQAKARF